MTPVDTAPTPRLLSIFDAVRLLKVSESTVKRLVRDRDIVSVKVGGRRMIPVESLDAYIERLKVAS